MNKTNTIIAIIVGLATLAGMVLGADRYLAKEDDLRLVEYRLDQKIMSDECRNLQQRIWMFEDRYGTDESKYPPEIKREIREMRQRLQDIKEKRERLRRNQQ